MTSSQDNTTTIDRSAALAPSDGFTPPRSATCVELDVQVSLAPSRA